MAIFLSVLKIIGIVLLGLIGFVLVLLLWFLFWPYSYFVKATKDQNISALARVSFFFRFISVNVIYDDGINIRLKILGIPIYDKKRRDTKKKLNKKSGRKKADVDVTMVSSNEFSDFEELQVSDKNKESKLSSFDHEEITSGEQVTEAVSEQVTDEEPTTEADDQATKEPFYSKVKAKLVSIYTKVSVFLSELPSRIEDFCENIEAKLDKAVDTYDYYSSLLNKKGSKYVIELLKKKLFRALKSVRPRKSKITVLYGSTDPEKTAKIIEAYSMALMFLPRNTRLVPDFEDDYLKFDISVKGRVCVGYILLIGLSIILNKRFRIFIKLLKREEIKNGRK